MDPILVEVTAVISGVVLVVLNFLGAKAAQYFGTMVFLDTVGTAIAGLQFGPLEGAVVGFVTNLATGKLLFPGYWRFFYVNVVCGLVWGFIGKYFSPTSSDVQLSIFILVAGGVVGLISTVLSVPLRIWSNFTTDHILDKVGREIENLNLNRWKKWVRIFIAELLLSHLLDRIIATTVGVLVVLEILIMVKYAHNITDLKPMYHNLVELLAGYYYVALGVVAKTIEVRLVNPATAEDDIIVLLGPLGFFSVLLAAPFLLQLVGAVLLQLSGEQ
ncbi:MAG: hypothetical protein ACREDD_07770 [Methylocella sp.]